MTKEKATEDAIHKILLRDGYLAETMKGGSVMTSKGGRTYKILLQSEGATDIICLVNGRFLGIEVKKDKEQYDKWLKIEKRYRGEGKPLPDPHFNPKGKLVDTYRREKAQIEFKQKILENGGDWMLTYSVEHFLKSFKELYHAETH